MSDPVNRRYYVKRLTERKCIRCAKPQDDAFRTCSKCRKKQNKARKRKGPHGNLGKAKQFKIGTILDLIG